MPVKKTLGSRKPAEKPVVRESTRQQENKDAPKNDGMPKKKTCFFCEKKQEPAYTDMSNLRRYVSDRSKIMGKQRTGACSKHQRRVTREIKYARHLSIIPFVNKL